MTCDRERHTGSHKKQRTRHRKREGGGERTMMMTRSRSFFLFLFFNTGESRGATRRGRQVQVLMQRASCPAFSAWTRRCCAVASKSRRVRAGERENTQKVNTVDETTLQIRSSHTCTETIYKPIGARRDGDRSCRVGRRTIKDTSTIDRLTCSRIRLGESLSTL